MFVVGLLFLFFFFFKQKTAYEMRISDWSSDVCSSDLEHVRLAAEIADDGRAGRDRIVDDDPGAAGRGGHLDPDLDDVAAHQPFGVGRLDDAHRAPDPVAGVERLPDRKSTRLNTSP